MDLPLLAAIAALVVLCLLLLSPLRPSIGMRAIGIVSAIIVCAFIFTLSPALAQTSPAPVAGDWMGGIVGLWGPLLGVVVALVLFFDRLAKLIPNSTTSGVLRALSWVATILGAKVPDVK